MSGFKTKLEAEKSQKNLSGNPNACSYCGSKIKEVSSFSVIIDVDSDDTDRYKAFCGCGQHVSSSSKKNWKLIVILNNYLELILVENAEKRVMIVVVLLKRFNLTIIIILN